MLQHACAVLLIATDNSLLLSPQQYCLALFTLVPFHSFAHALQYLIELLGNHTSVLFD